MLKSSSGRIPDNLTVGTRGRRHARTEEYRVSTSKGRVVATKQVTRHSNAARVGTKATITIDETYELYRRGLSTREISVRRGIREETIEEHLIKCFLEGRKVEISRHVNTADFALIENAIAAHGGSRLKPVREALPEHITYGMIRFVLAYLQRAETEKAKGG